MSTPDTRGGLSQWRILLVWLPLAATWFIMGMEQPAVTAVIARLGAEKINLAAFGIALSFVFIMESPILQLLTAATALSTSRANYRRLFMFTAILAGAMTLVHLVFGVTPVFDLLMLRLLKIPVDIVEPARRAYLIMTPGILLVAYRRLWQGVLIRYQHTTIVGVAMLTRIVGVALGLVGGALWLKIDGASVGAVAMTIGMLFSAASVFYPARRVVRTEMPENDAKDITRADTVGSGETLTWRKLLAFYTPLALTSFIGLAARPLLTMGIALAPSSVESLAVWPVLLGFLFLFTSTNISFQEVVVTLYRGAGEFYALRRFAVKLAIATSGIFFLTAALPLSNLWFRHVAGLSSELLRFTVIPMFILSLIPGLVSLVSWFRGVLVARKETITITRAVLLNLLFLVIPVFVGARLLPMPGAITAAGAYVLALAAEMLYLKGKIFPGKSTREKFSHSG